MGLKPSQERGFKKLPIITRSSQLKPHDHKPSRKVLSVAGQIGMLLSPIPKACHASGSGRALASIGKYPARSQPTSHLKKHLLLQGKAQETPKTRPGMHKRSKSKKVIQNTEDIDKTAKTPIRIKGIKSKALNP
jgi:hypothetical protein